MADLAERWQLTEDEVRHRIKHLDLPGFNVGTKKAPDWRFRLSTVELWEAQHEQRLAPDVPAVPTIPPGAPPGWDGINRVKLDRPSRRGPRGNRSLPGPASSGG
jgi:hypothetical protein